MTLDQVVIFIIHQLELNIVAYFNIYYSNVLTGDFS